MVCGQIQRGKEKRQRQREGHGSSLEGFEGQAPWMSLC